jgi:hypothetical protein
MMIHARGAHMQVDERELQITVWDKATKTTLGRATIPVCDAPCASYLKSAEYGR